MLEAAGPSALRVTGLAPVALSDSICAPAAPCACAPQDNLALHRLLRTAPEGAALVCEAGGRADGGYFGELAAIDSRNRGFAGLVIDGSVRDGAQLARLGFPVFHAGFAPATCGKMRVVSVGETVRIGGAEVAPGDQIVADSDGILVVPRAQWPEVEAGAWAIRKREEEIRAELERGRRLADLLELPA